MWERGTAGTYNGKKGASNAANASGQKGDRFRRDKFLGGVPTKCESYCECKGILAISNEFCNGWMNCM